MTSFVVRFDMLGAVEHWFPLAPNFPSPVLSVPFKDVPERNVNCLQAELVLLSVNR